MNKLVKGGRERSELQERLILQINFYIKPDFD